MGWAVVSRWWWLAVVVLATSACNASFDVLVTVNDDGSGMVETTTTIDDEAAGRLLDLDEEASGLLLADLAQSGWAVERPEVAADGSTVIRASKAFGTTSQFADVMEELAGPDSPYKDFALVRTKSFARVDYELTGTIDTSIGFSSFGDEELEAALGRSLLDIAERYGATEEEVTFSVGATLPGELQSERQAGLVNTPEGLVSARWQANLADNETQSIRLATSTSNLAPRVLVGVAILAGVLALLIVFAQVLRVLLPDRRRTRKRQQRPRRPARPSPEATGEREVVAPTTTGPVAAVGADDAGRPFSVVALDAMGVLYRHGHDVEELLIPFIREKGALGVSDDEISARARALDLGRITSRQFWEAVGVRGDPAELDREYVARHQLTPGVIRYLRTLREDAIQVACVANVCASWANTLKANHSLTGLVDPWVVSGSVGVRKPDKPIFEVLRRLTGVAPGAIQVIDDDVAVLDVARDLGFATTWFSPNGNRDDANDHPVLRSFGVSEDEVEPDPPARSDPPRTDTPARSDPPAGRSDGT